MKRVYNPEIKNRPISEAEKAAKMEEVMEAVKGTEGLSETEILLNETEKFRDVHKEIEAYEKQELEDINNTFELKYNRKIIDFNDSQKIDDAISKTEDKMVSEGKYVEIRDSDIDLLADYFPDLRTMKKTERNVVIKQKNGELKEAIKNMLRQCFDGKNIEFEINGNIIEAHLYKKSIDHVSKMLTKRKAAVLNKTAEIFKKAEYVYSSFTDEHNSNKDIEGWDYFYVPIELPNEMTGVKISILSNNRVNENQIYDWDEKKTPLDGARRSLENEVQRNVSSSVSNDIIHPVSGFDNTSTIGNSIFGAENFDNNNIFNNKENDVVTETFEKMAAETVSAEISDSAKRVLKQMEPKTEKQSSESK